MPSADTLSIPAIRDWASQYISGTSIDPFARNCRLAKFTNDLNPNTSAEYHMDAASFLEMFSTKGIAVDVAIFDPPYSPRQVKECYDGIGRHFGVSDQQNTGRWTKEKELLAAIVRPGGIVLSFGWNTIGMGKGRGYEAIDVLDVYHGGAHNDTLCIAEQKTTVLQEQLFPLNKGEL